MADVFPRDETTTRTVPWKPPDDALFWRAFLDRSIPPAEFGHEAHLRVAYLAIEAHGVGGAAPVVREGLRELLELARVRGVAPKTGYHETITVFWLRMTAHRMRGRTFSDSIDFVRNSSELLDKRLLSRHYTKGLLMSDEARAAFIEPDLSPLPKL